MRTLSFAQASIYATGAFIGVLALFAGATAIAIGGPLTKYEQQGLGEGAGEALHDVKGAIHRLRSGVCRRLPAALRDMTPCPTAKLALAKPHAGSSTSAPHAHAAPSHAPVSPPHHHALRRATPHGKPPHRR